MKCTLKISIILAVFALMTPGFISASGIISQQIEIKDAMRGQTIEELLSVVNSGDSEILFKLSAEGDIADWVSFKKYGDIEGLLNEVTAPPKDWAKAKVFIKVPDDAPNGEYNGHLVALLSVVPDQEKTDKISVGIAQKFRRPVKIIVTDVETVDFNVRIMPEKYFINKIEPLKIKLIYVNNGNISIRPHAQIKVFNPDGKEIFNAIYPYPESEASVCPRATKVITVVHHSGELQEGRYQVEAIITLNGEEKYRDDFYFTVGTFVNENSSFEFSKFIASIGGGSMTFGYILVGGFILLLSIFSFKIIKKISEKKKEIAMTKK